jgi:hypothetical protein
MALYAIKDIKFGDELLFDYDGNGSLSTKYEWINNKSLSSESESDSHSDSESELFKNILPL